MRLRSYQEEALTAIGEALAVNRSTLAVMPTASGKTIVFAHAIERFSRKRALVLAHRVELIRQAADKIELVTGERPDVEMASERADLHMFRRSKVVVASKDTLHPKRLEKFRPDEFDLIVSDEAHHSCAVSYRHIYEYFKDAKHIGVTATPDRLDEKALGQVFDSVAFVYEIVDAINDGWLVPVSVISKYLVDLDFSNVKTTAGDLNQKQLAELMEHEKLPQAVADEVVRAAQWRKTVVFAASVKAAEMLAEIINRHKPNSARCVFGHTPEEERAATFADYKTGRFQFLVNVGVATEGWDEPTVEMVAVARPTESRALYAQMIGRGTRTLPGIVDNCEDSPEARKAAIARSRKSCIAEGQRVLTDRGLVPIENVTTAMKVWDGVDFVSHCGTVFRGQKEVIEYAGLIATPDHEVWTAQMWKTFGECAAQQVPISVTGVEGESVPETAGCFRGVRSEGGEIIPDGRMYGMRKTVSPRATQLAQGCGWMQAVWASSTGSEVARDAGIVRKRSLHKSEVSSIQALWSQGNQVQVFWPHGNGGVGPREPWLAARQADRSDQQRWTLRSRESSLCHAEPELLQHQRPENQCGYAQVQTGASGDRIFRRNTEATSEGRSGLEGDSPEAQCPGQSSARAIQGTRRVFDIVNAGPRNRFTVEGLLVSNCILILDFEGNAGRHKLITPVDILGGKYDDEVVLLAERKIREAGGTMLVAEALSTAEADLHKEREIARRQKLVGRATYESRTVDPFNVFDLEPKRERGWDRGKSPTEPQIAFLNKNGIDTAELSRGRASQIIGEIIDRRKKGKCSFKMARLLRKNNLDPNMSFEDARRAIDEIAARQGWKKKEVVEEHA